MQIPQTTIADFPSMSTKEMLASRAKMREANSTDPTQRTGARNEEPFTMKQSGSQPTDTLEISSEGQAAADRLEARQQKKEANQSETTKEDKPARQTNSSDKTDRPAKTDDAVKSDRTDENEQNAEASRKAQQQAEQSGELTESERQTVAKLKARDAEVRAHEAAHKAVGGNYAGGVSFSYQTGPDGNRYAVGGEVGISTGKGGTPEETITKARQVRAAALAPAQPSSQDLQVAAAATQMENAARAEKIQEDQQEQETTTQSDSETEDATPSLSISA